MLRRRNRDGTVSRGDYTNDPGAAVPGEPEVVEAEVAEHYSAEARARFNVTHADEQLRRERRTLKRQLEQAHARAASRGIDITPEIERVRAAVASIENRLR